MKCNDMFQKIMSPNKNNNHHHHRPHLEQYEERKQERERESARGRGRGRYVYIYNDIFIYMWYIYTVESSIIHLLPLLQAPRNLSRTSSPSRGGASSPSRGRTLSPRGGATSSGTLQRQGHGRGAWVERVNHHCLCNFQRCPCFIPTQEEVPPQLTHILRMG